MLLCVWRPLALGVMVMLCGAAARSAAPPQPAAASATSSSVASPSACVDRVAQAASAVAVRLPDLRYTCLALRNGQRVLVGQAGLQRAPTVLLVHGLGNNAHRDWASVVPALAGQFHVVTLDLPGFGASEASPQGYSFDALGHALKEVLEQTAPGKRVHVVGHSLGGAVSLHFAHVHPGTVDRLVLVDAAGILLKTVFAQHVASMRTRQLGIDPVDRFLKGLGERINGLRRIVFNDLDDRFDFSRWLAQNPSVRYALLGRYTQVEAGLGLVEHDFTAAIREVQAPTTVIWGRDDPVAPVRTGNLLASRLPDARLRVIDGVGHTPMQESPTTFMRLLQEALASPLSPKYAVDVPEVSKGAASCLNEPDRSFSGHYDSITLDNCSNARISGAKLRQLTVKASSVTIEDSVIDSDDVALSTQASQLTATSLRLRGRVAIRADNSRLDLAGVSLQATERGVEMLAPSRLYFSVSDWQAPDFNGDAHFLWPLSTGQR
jgi:pimeloyl-ACP methyl ester carboxylesterase